MSLIQRFRNNRDHNRAADEFRVLMAMRDGQPAYGYPLSQASRVRPGRMYRALTRLIAQGLVENGWGQPAPGHPSRRWYRLTAHGMHEASPKLLRSPLPPIGDSSL